MIPKTRSATAYFRFPSAQTFNLLRLIWGAVTLFSGTIFIISTWIVWDAGLFIESETTLAMIDAAFITMVGTDFLSNSAVQVVATGQVIIFVGLGVFLFWHKHNDGFALVTSMMLWC